MRVFNLPFLVCAGLCVVVLTACGTSDGALRDQGRSESSILGFHDGRHSGMKEAGNYLEHMIKDVHKFEEDFEYRSGWLAGEAEGKRMQEQANAAASSYNAGKAADKAGPHPHDAMEKAMKGVDAEQLKALES